MKSWGILRSAGIVVAVTVGLVAIGVAPASAATDQEVAEWITGATLEKLGVTEPDADLSAALNSSISEALAAGLISLSAEELAEDAIDDPDAVGEDDIEDTLDEGLEEQGEAWDAISTAWHEAFDEIKADFADCRTTAEGGADLCAHQFRYEMQVNHVTAWLARHTAKVGDITSLPADEQEAALAKLERQGELAAARLERAGTQLEKKTGEPVDDDLIDDVATTIEETSGDNTTSKPGKSDKAHKADKAGKADKGSKGNGNGNQGSGNGKSGR